MSTHPRRTKGRGASIDDRNTTGESAQRIGDRLGGDAIEELVRQHQSSLRAYLRYLGCATSSVDDLAQETFLTFLSANFDVVDDRSTAKFLRSIARHLFLKSLRSADPQSLAEELDDADATWVRYLDQDGGGPYLDALKACLRVVKGRTKAALALRYESGLGRGAIADRLGASESAVHSMLVRVRRSLRECVERRLQA